MFIRKKYTKDLKTNQIYSYYQLIESVRTKKGPRQRILLNLGSSLGLKPDELATLAKRIEEILHGQMPLFPASAKVEALAQGYASRLIKNLSQPMPEQEPTAAVPDYATVNLNDVHDEEIRTIGTEDLLFRIAKELQLPEKMQTLGMSEKDVAIALGSIIGRATFPASERGTRTHLIAQSGCGELLNLDFAKVSLNHFYQISDVLFQHKAILEQHITSQQHAVHQYATTINLYDLSNTYFEGQAKGNPKAKRGHSKEKRLDCPLITLGLVLSGQGFLQRCEFLPGNISEPSSLEHAIETLHPTEALFKPTIVLDAGIATEENLQWLRNKDFTYIVSARQKAPPTEILGEPISVGKKQHSQVRVQEAYKDDLEKWLYCESLAKGATASSMKTLFQQKFEQDLQALSTALQKPRGIKKLSKVWERIGRLKEKHQRIAACYDIQITPSKDGQTALAIKWTLLSEKLADKFNGRYYLRTNLVKMEIGELWKIYNNIRTVEEAFRFMKSSLGFRSVYHQKEQRVDGHLWITVMAYTLIQDILYRLAQKGLNYNWNTIRSGMQSRGRVTTRFKTNQNETIRLRKTSDPEYFHQQIYEALGFCPNILKTKKVVS